MMGMRLKAHLPGANCAMCHGIDGVGANGPQLNHSGLKHGDSNFAIYKVLRDGISGTPMVPPSLSSSERWQVVGYLSDLMMHGNSQGIDEAIHLNINVNSEQLRSAGSKTDEWLTYSGSFDGHRYTPLAQINNTNVSQLRIRWIQQFAQPGIQRSNQRRWLLTAQCSSRMPPSNVVALDAKSTDR